MSVVTTDPKGAPVGQSTWLDRILGVAISDDRDLIFVRMMLLMTLVVPALAATLFLLPPPWVLLLGAPYIAFVFLSFGLRYGLMLHAVGHRPIFRPGFTWLHAYLCWGLGPFFGHTPTSFEAHHLGMHHAEENALSDLSSTLPYVRDRPLHFLHYWARFLFFGFGHLILYLVSKGRSRLAGRLVLGEISWGVLVVVALSVNWAAALVVFVIPMVVMRCGMIAGNFGQHAFVDLTDPENAYKNSCTIINSRYNHVAYNDGYHTVHHLVPGGHYLDMATHFEEHYEQYVLNDAIVFEGLNDNQHIWFLLMLGNYDKLARHLVDFKGRSHDEKVAFLQSRTREASGSLPPLLPWSASQASATLGTPSDVSGASA